MTVKRRYDVHMTVKQRKYETCSLTGTNIPDCDDDGQLVLYYNCHNCYNSSNDNSH